MSQANKQVVTRLLEEGLGNGDVAVIDELIAADAEYEGPAPDGRSARERVREMVTGLHGALDGLTCELERMIAEGDRVAVRVRLGGTNVAEWETMAPSGRPVAFTMIAILEVHDGRVTRYLDARDNISIWVQIGDVPAHLRRYADGEGS